MQKAIMETTRHTWALLSTLALALLAVVITAVAPPQAHADGNAPCPSQWPGAVHDSPIEYQDFFVEVKGWHQTEWFVIRSRDSNGYVHISAYVADDQYALGYAPGEACTLVVRRPSDEDPNEWVLMDDPVGVDADRHALAVLYRTTGGNEWNNNDGWLTSRPLSEWHGVTTNADGRVVELNLIDNSLVGSIPARLADLSQIQRLELWDNQLSGPIPPEFGDMISLEYVDLDQNRLSGTIPPELGSLTNLTYLGLDVNQLTGEMPKELSSLTKLTALELHENQLSGTIPVWLADLPNLEVLSLSDNDFTGPIPPELAELSELAVLWLSSNQLTGPIPPEFGNLTKLLWLNLHNNQITGQIPPELVNMTDAINVTISGNEITGCIPSAMRTIYYNDFHITGLPFCDTDQ